MTNLVHIKPDIKDAKRVVENFPKLKKNNKIAKNILKIAQKITFIIVFLNFFIEFFKNKILQKEKTNPLAIPKNKKINIQFN